MVRRTAIARDAAVSPVGAALRHEAAAARRLDHPFAPLGTPLADRDATLRWPRRFVGTCQATRLAEAPAAAAVAGYGPGSGGIRAERKARRGAGRVRGASPRRARSRRRPPARPREVIGAKRCARRAACAVASARSGRWSSPSRARETRSRRHCSDSLRWSRRLERRGGHRADSECHTSPLRGVALDTLARRGEATVAELSLDGRVVASVIASTQRRSPWSWKMAYERDGAFSPGLQAMTNLTAGSSPTRPSDSSTYARRRNIR